MTLTLRNLTLLALPIVAILASCTLAPDHCLAMSDCDDGSSCVEGLCQGPPPQTLSSQADATALGTDATASSPATIPDASATTTDAGTVTDSAADATDDAMTDAATDG